MRERIIADEGKSSRLLGIIFGDKPVEVEISPGELRNRGIDFHSVYTDARMVRDEMLGVVVAPASQDADALDRMRCLEHEVIQLQIFEHELGVALFQVGARLHDAAHLEQPHGLACVVGYLVYTGFAEHRARAQVRRRSMVAPKLDRKRTRRYGCCRTQDDWYEGSFAHVPMIPL